MSGEDEDQEYRTCRQCTTGDTAPKLILGFLTSSGPIPGAPPFPEQEFTSELLLFVSLRRIDPANGRGNSRRRAYPLRRPAQAVAFACSCPRGGVRATCGAVGDPHAARRCGWSPRFEKSSRS